MNDRRTRGRGRNPEPCKCIGVFGLSKRTDRETLQKTFDKYGKINILNLIMNKYRTESLGYGFITYDTLESATKAIRAASGMELDGSVIRVDYSITKRAHTPTPGVYRGKVTSSYNDRYSGRNDRYRRRDSRDDYYNDRNGRDRRYDNRRNNRRDRRESYDTSRSRSRSRNYRRS